MMYKKRASLFTFLLIGTLGLIFFATSSAYAACLDGMTSYWKLEEAGNPYADSVDGNDGAGVGTVAQVAGRVGFGQEFNGTNSEINVAADGSFGWGKDESFSIEYWMKKPATPGAIEVLVGRKGTTANPNWWVGLTADGYANFELSDRDGNGQDITGSVDLGNNAWHHVVVVRDAAADMLRLYVDGAEAATPRATSYTAGFDSLTAAINMGWLENTSGYRYTGILDEVALYDRALTSGEIENHYESGLLGRGIDDLLPTDDDDDDDDGGGGGGGGGGCFIATAVE